MEAELRRRRRRVGDEGATFMCRKGSGHLPLQRGTPRRRWSHRFSGRRDGRARRHRRRDAGSIRRSRRRSAARRRRRRSPGRRGPIRRAARRGRRCPSVARSSAVALGDVAGQRVERERASRAARRRRRCPRRGVRRRRAPSRRSARGRRRSHPVARRPLGEDAGQLAAVEQQVVGPLQRRRRRRRTARAASSAAEPTRWVSCVRVRRHVAEQQRHEQVRAWRCVPAPVEAPSPGDLVVGDEHGAVAGVARLDGGEQVGVRAARHRRRGDGPSGAATVPRARCFRVRSSTPTLSAVLRRS